MIEREMGYRGSKSTADILNYTGTTEFKNNMFVVVKEQRLDGGCIGNNFPMLRYSLTGFERNYQVKILSNQISFTQSRFYSTNRLTTMNMQDENSSLQLSPWLITGISDGESCFYVGVQKNSNSKMGWTVELIYTITLHKKDKDILEQIKNYFGLGYITHHGINTLQYRIKSVKDLKVILEHFDKYPLITQKQGDFILFKMAFNLVKTKEHLKMEGLNKIVGIRASLNTGIKANLKEAFPQAIPVVRPLVVERVVPDPEWFAGFASAEACFLVNIKKSTSHICGYQVWLIFTLTQDVRDEQLMKTFETYLGCGSMEKTSREVVNFNVRKLSDIQIQTVVLPFFLKYPILGVKFKDFQDWCKVADLMMKNKHLTLSGVEEIRRIKSGMNTLREYL